MPMRRWNGFSAPSSCHSACSSRMRRSMAMAMRTQARASSLTPFDFRVAEEHHDRIADIFVDGGAVLERDVRHFGQITVEQMGEVFRFELVGGLGEIDHVGEEDGQLLAVRGDLDILRAGEDRVVDLRREIFRELLGQRLELLVLRRDDLVGAALLLGERVELLLVPVAQLHQPARGAEQLLIVLEQLLVELAVAPCRRSGPCPAALAPRRSTCSSAANRSSEDIRRSSSQDGTWRSRGPRRIPRRAPASCRPRCRNTSRHRPRRPSWRRRRACPSAS